VFLSQVHTAIDWVLIGSVIPGATVTVTHRGKVVGRQAISGSTASIQLKFEEPFNQGDTLEAAQAVAIAGRPSIQGPTVNSLPAEGFDLERPPLPPNVTQPLLECDTLVTLTDIAQGATAQVTLPSGTFPFPFFGATIRAHVPELPFPGTVTVSQQFQNRNLTSVPGPAVAISDSPPPPPRLLEPICPDASTVRVIGLRAGSEVSFDRRAGICGCDQWGR
jgi:hypothetical protein